MAGQYLQEAFLNEVSVYGYLIQENDDPIGLTRLSMMEHPDILELQTGKGLRKVNIMESYPDLFTKFVDTVPSLHNYLDLANQFGLLWGGGEDYREWRSKDGVSTLGYLGDELLHSWRTAITRLRIAVHLWEYITDAIKIGDFSTLNKMFKWAKYPKKGIVLRYIIGEKEFVNSHATFEDLNESVTEMKKYDCRLSDVLIGRYYHSDYNLGDFCDGEYPFCQGVLTFKELDTNRNADVISFANLILRTMINDAISGGATNITLKPVLDNGWKIDIIPSCLHTALWLQLLNAVVGNRIFRRCRICGEWEELDPNDKRSLRWERHNRCAVRVRVQRHRDRKKQGGNDINS